MSKAVSNQADWSWQMGVGVLLYALCVSVANSAQVVPGVQMGAASVRSSVFSPSLTLIQPPTVKSNVFYNIGLIWDAEVNALTTGYRVKYGTNVAQMTNVLSVPPTDTFCTVSNLALKPTWYFQVAATWGATNVTEFSNTVRVQEPLTNLFTLTAIFPLYQAASPSGPWVTNSVALVTITNGAGNNFFKSHFRQLGYVWTNNQVRLVTFTQ